MGEGQYFFLCLIINLINFSVYIRLICMKYILFLITKYQRHISVRITLFYIIYYTFLTAFFIVMLQVFFKTLREDRPTWTMEDGGLIGLSWGQLSRSQIPALRFTLRHNTKWWGTFLKLSTERKMNHPPPPLIWHTGCLKKKGHSRLI